MLIPITDSTIIAMLNENYQPSIAGLRAFVAVAEYHHFGTAAKKLNVTQPTLSQSLAALEQGLGVTLVERSTRRVEITDIGKQLLKKSNAILEAIDSLSVYAENASSKVNNIIKIGIIPTIAPYVIPDLLQITSSVGKGKNSISLHIIEDKTDNLLEQLKAGKLDVLLLALPLTSASFTQVPLYREEFYVVYNGDHPFAKRETPDVSLEDLTKEQVILLSEGHCFRDQVVDLCRLNSIKPDFLPTKAASLSTAVQCAAGGVGVTFIPASAKKVEVNGNKNLFTSSIGPIPPTRTVGLVFKNTSSRAEQFLNFAKEIKNLPYLANTPGITIL